MSGFNYLIFDDHNDSLALKHRMESYQPSGVFRGLISTDQSISSSINTPSFKIDEVDSALIKALNIDTILFSDRINNFSGAISLISKLYDDDVNVQFKRLTREDLLVVLNERALFSNYKDSIFQSISTIHDQLVNKCILITGAAGSIGSELSRLILQYRPKRLIILDSAESSLYNLQQDLEQLGLKNFDPIIADIRDFERMEFLISTYRPDIIFHAAAYKHVPLMERFPQEAVKVNIKGTKILADLSLKYRVSKFVFISTDKAVNPTNIMGATKRIAELYLRHLQEKHQGYTNFVITRFGNVLDSNGSVIPLFRRQLRDGGPLTITHHSIKRYFISLDTACQLILDVLEMSQGGQTYVLDMGNPIKIEDLAKCMVLLSNQKNKNLIEIKSVGLRPGEKFHEELVSKNERLCDTSHRKIHIAKSDQNLNYLSIEKQIDVLCNLKSNAKSLEFASIMKSILPEYTSKNSIYEILDQTTDDKD